MPASTSNEEFLRYAILLTRTGAAFEEPLIRRHVEYLRKLDREGRLVLCGPFTDYRGGMVIIRAASLEEARGIAADDPFVSEGAETFEVRTWLLSCEENSHLGMG